MKIFFSGAQGTGKSTLVYEIAKLLPELTVEDSMSKIFMDTKEIQTDFNNDRFLDFQTKITLYHLNNMINVDNVICSRSTADSYAYMMYAYQHSNNDNVKSLLSSLLDVVEQCNLIQKNQGGVLNIYVPIMFEISDGGNSLRNTDKQYQQDIDSLLANYTSEGYNFYTVKSLSIEDRVKEIMGVIKEFYGI